MKQADPTIVAGGKKPPQPDDKRFHFSANAYAFFASSFWRMPSRLARDGLLAKLWRANTSPEKGHGRNGGAVASLLPVLAAHVFEGKRTAAGRRVGLTWRDPEVLADILIRHNVAVSGDLKEASRDHSIPPSEADEFFDTAAKIAPWTMAQLFRADGAYRDTAIDVVRKTVTGMSAAPSGQVLAAGRGREPSWTGWSHVLTDYRLHKLSGLSETTVRVAMNWLEENDLAQVVKVAPPPGVGGWPRKQFRLSMTLYPRPLETDPKRSGEEYAYVPGTLFYSGLWRLLPTNGARAVMLAIMALDPVKHEEGMIRSIENSAVEPVADSQSKAAKLSAIRSRQGNALSVPIIGAATGMSDHSVRESLKLLQTSVKGIGGPIVQSGAAGLNGLRWFSVSSSALRWDVGKIYPNYFARIDTFAGTRSLREKVFSGQSSRREAA